MQVGSMMRQCCSFVRSLLKTHLVIDFIDSCLLLSGDECSVAKAEHNWTSHEEEEVCDQERKVSDQDEEGVSGHAEDVGSDCLEVMPSGEGNEEPTADGKMPFVTTKPLCMSEKEVYLF